MSLVFTYLIVLSPLCILKRYHWYNFWTISSKFSNRIREEKVDIRIVNLTRWEREYTSFSRTSLGFIASLLLRTPCSSLSWKYVQYYRMSTT